jgi:hypothetical protein
LWTVTTTGSGGPARNEAEHVNVFPAVTTRTVRDPQVTVAGTLDPR